MCSDEQFFVNLNSLRKPQEVTLGDGHVLEAIGEGTVPLRLCLPGGGTKKCDLQKVLFVPKLSHNWHVAPESIIQLPLVVAD